MLASDDGNREFTGARNPDDVLHVTFFMRTNQDNFKSQKEGHPIYRDEEWVRIMLPGRTDLTVEEPVHEGHKERFPRQWMVFQNKTAGDEHYEGTPVTEWPVLTRAQAEELKGKKFYTVEQVAACSDAQIQALGMNANILRTKARAYLSHAKDTAAAQHTAAELQKKQEENEDLKKQLASLNESVSMLIAADKQAKQQAAQVQAKR